MQEYIKADQQIHWLSQLVAKVNRAYVMEQQDDSHTNLYFDPLSDRLLSRWIETPIGNHLFTLNLKNLSFEWLNSRHQKVDSILIFDKSLGQLEQEICKYPASLGIPVGEIANPLHFEIPEYGIHQISQSDILFPGIERWEKIRKLSNQACLTMLGYLQAESEIRIWPHHFDTGIYVQVDTSLGLGFGLAMKDEMVGDSYFYMAGYANQSKINYENTPNLSDGRWFLTDNWKGAVLPLSRISDQLNGKANDEINVFLKESIEWFLIQ